jgi:hypothetical protein
VGSPPPCDACRHFKPRGDDAGDVERCMNPRAERTSVQARTYPSVQREPGFFGSYEWGGFCGKRGRWFEARIDAHLAGEDMGRGK